MQTQPDLNPLPIAGHRPDALLVQRAIEKRSFATLATASAAGRPHVAGVLYELAGDMMYVNTMRSSRKARNVMANSHVAVCVPIRRVPVGPPSTVHFQTVAAIVECSDPALQALVADGELKSVTSHGELDLAGSCFLRFGLPPRLLTYGLGMSIREFAANPLAAGGLVAPRTSS